MHPAPSIIIFTTLSGLGYGLAAILGLGILDPAAPATRIAHLVALVLISAGLLSSTLHLGNPQRAWRAFSQWRSSWLSREGVMAVATFLPLLCSAWASVVDLRYLQWPGLLGSACCAVTVFCTSMIYASLKSVQAWHTPLTPVAFLATSLSGGLILATVVGFSGGGEAVAMAFAAILATLLSWRVTQSWRRRIDEMRPLSTPESATGLGPIGGVRLFERPHVNDNYLTREMGFRVARKHAGRLRRIALAAGAWSTTVLLGLAVVLLVVAPGPALAAAALALAAHLLGVLVDRWLFFAEARHAVMNYYGG